MSFVCLASDCFHLIFDAGPPIRGTLVVAIGQGLEALTGGVCASTTHRVLSPEAGKGARFSIPFFQVRLPLHGVLWWSQLTT